MSDKSSGLSQTASANSEAAASGKSRIVEIRAAGSEHQVLTVESTNGSYRRKPCSDCPWRVDAIGEFPADAFRHSANTATDMATRVFSCHQSGAARPATCAGFLLRGADNNLAVRLGFLRGIYASNFNDGGVELHDSFVAMAIANGVSPDDPCLRACR